MQKFLFNGEEYTSNEKETILDVLISKGASIPYSCQSGVCHTCLVKAVKGNPSQNSQNGLKATLVKQKYFLACQCIPENYLEIALAGEDVNEFYSATVQAKSALSDDIISVSLKPEAQYNYHAGQFLNLYRNDGLIRSYSIASVAELDDTLELHVQRVDGGEMSGWIHNELTVGDSLTIGGSLGECFYAEEDKTKPLILIGTGSGLAPLIGILRDALNQEHSGPIHLFHGSRRATGLYLSNELNQIAAQYPNVSYTGCLSGKEELPEGVVRGRATDVALKQLNRNLKNYTAYICGNPEMVEATRKAVFLSGASMKDIYADSFVFSHNNPPEKS